MMNGGSTGLLACQLEPCSNVTSALDRSSTTWPDDQPSASPISGRRTRTRQLPRGLAFDLSHAVSNEMKRHSVSFSKGLFVLGAKFSSDVAPVRAGCQGGSGQISLGLAVKNLARVTLFACLLMAPRASFGAFECKDDSWQGTSELLAIARQQLGKRRVKLVADLDYAHLVPADGVLVLHPTVTLNEVSLTAFLQAGGRVALLDDYGQADGFFGRFGIGRVRAPLKPRQSLRDNPNLPIAVPADHLPDGTKQPRHPTVTQVDRLVLNHPTALTHPGLTPILQVPTASEAPAVVALSGLVGTRHPGRLLVMSDPSALINQMLRYPGNRAFAIGLVRYLVADDEWGRRGGTLYIVANRFEQSGSYSPTLGPGERTRKLVWDLERTVRGSLPVQGLLSLAALAALGVLRWTVLYAGRRYRRLRPPCVTVPALATQAGWPGKAAVLTAPTTHPILALLELKSAMEDQFRVGLGLAARSSVTEIKETIARRNLLDRDRSDDLARLVKEFQRLERAFVERQRPRLSRRRVDDIRNRALDIVRLISHRAGRRA